jgi:hypothetical protein
MAECGIALQRTFLLSRRHILIVAQPVAGMSWSGLRGWLMILIWMILIRIRMILTRARARMILTRILIRVALTRR